MQLLNISFELPFKEPVLVFTLVLLIILFAPLLASKLRLPGIIGLILSGILIGPNGFHLLNRDISIVLFGTVGLLYIMFIAGLEIDMNDFKKNRNKSIIFGVLSFLVSQIFGFVAGYYFLKFSIPASILFGSMLGSHTLLAYPIASKLGITKSRSATITVGGTIVADLLSLLVLAVIADSARGQLNSAFWIRLVVSMAIYVFVIVWGLPRLGKWFFRNVQSEGVSQYIFVLAAVFATAFLAEVAGLEPIIGAFLAGLVLNRLIPHSSPLMNRIEFVGNALFIPFFLISVGMLVDLRVLVNGLEAWIVAITMIIIANAGKWLAAFFTQKLFNYSVAERNVIFGLSNARAAATLTAVLIGYDLGILNENVLNGTILMILVTCVVSSLVVEKAGRKLAIIESQQMPDLSSSPNRILVPISNPATIEHLIDFAILIKEPHSHEPIYPLAVVKDAEDTDAQLMASNKMLQKAILHASATENAVQLVSRIDINIASGILRAMRELMITEVVIGWNGKVTARERMFGSILDNLLEESHQMIMVCKILHPLNTMERLIVAVAPNAEKEKGFFGWVNNIRVIARQIGTKVQFYSTVKTAGALQSVLNASKPTIEASFKTFDDWEHFSDLGKEITTSDLFMVVSARQETVSYTTVLDRIPKKLARDFDDISFVIVYPQQSVSTNLNTAMPITVDSTKEEDSDSSIYK
ncbi:cation:proton antiporter [Rhodocytophaga aerolata]|uniref:Cation:proton antiporter n=1 Tax=Rhodocytophaga aerolata TaxID=455078 RepID=A0ABT8RA73_9BACT|nr:cation:proton antiporter [Rhodocytophaga aerolata]MDO1448894.1 cation:proton antiporter [Rhodocytophaga aerolata]